ncbi:hypothetical protein A2U01_0056532, partial [Trifolium medium]|nr:hypothetical protein [Trifolium medium]
CSVSCALRKNCPRVARASMRTREQLLSSARRAGVLGAARR